MRKLIDTLAVLSFVVSASVVAAGVTIYVKKDAIIDHVKTQAQEQITGFITETVGDAVTGAIGGNIFSESLDSKGTEDSGIGLPPVTLPF